MNMFHRFKAMMAAAIARGNKPLARELQRVAWWMPEGIVQLPRRMSPREWIRAWTRGNSTRPTPRSPEVMEPAYQVAERTRSMARKRKGPRYDKGQVA